jgi:transposase
MWFAGIDWADTKHDVLVLDERGHRLGVRPVPHSVEGLNELNDFLMAISGPDRQAEMACIIETNHGLLITALLEAGFAVSPVNPKTLDHKRSASGAKTDRIDADLLAKHGRCEIADLRRLHPDSPIIAELKALTRDQDSLIQSQTRLVNQLTAALKASYPVALQLFSCVAATQQLALFADLSHSTRSHERHSFADRRGAQNRRPSSAREDSDQDCRATASTPFDR